MGIKVDGNFLKNCHWHPRMPPLSKPHLSSQNGSCLLPNMWLGLPFPSGTTLHTRYGASYCFCQTATKHLTKAVQCNKHSWWLWQIPVSQPSSHFFLIKKTPKTASALNTGVTLSAVWRSKRLKDLAYIKLLLAQGSSNIQKTFWV